MGNDKQKHGHNYNANQCLANEVGGPGGHLRYGGLEKVTFTSSIPFVSLLPGMSSALRKCYTFM